MKVQVEELSKVEAKILAEVSAEDVDKELDAQFREVSRSVSLRGFRKGKAPRSLLEARFGKEVRAETANALLSSNIVAAIEESKLDLVGEPSVDADELEPGKPFTFRIQAELRPDVEPKDYRGVALPPLSVEVPSEDVDKRLEAMRNQHSTLVPLDEGTEAEKGMVLSIDFEGFRDGELFEGGSGNDMPIALGEGSFIPGFEDALLGIKAGEQREFDLTFPADYGNEELAGQQVTFKVTAKEVKRRELPALDDAFAKDLGEDSLLALRGRIREELQGYVARQKEEERERLLFDKLLEANEFELPPRLLAAHVERQKARLADTLRRSGFPDSELDTFLAERNADLEEQAAREVRQHFLIQAIAKEEELEVEDADLEAHFEKLAERYGMPVPRVKAMFHNESASEGLRGELLERKVIEALLEWSVEGEATTEAEAEPEAETEVAPEAETEAEAETPTETETEDKGGDA